MSADPTALERECELQLRRHLAAEGEATLHSAYQLGRTALEREVGVLDLCGALLRAAFTVLAADAGREPAALPVAGVERFALEALSPFEMAHRGARDAYRSLRRMDEIREAEIRRIAHELHDSSGQLLASLHLALDDLGRDLAPRSRPRLERAKVLLVRVEEQLRRLSHEFRPTVLDDLGLEAAIRELADSFSMRAGTRVSVEARLDERLPSAEETALYRIVQEALTNVIRHARATRATVRLLRRPDQVICTVEDDGVGLDEALPSGREPGHGMGLKGMCERAAGLGGTCSIESPPGRGTRITVTIPLEESHVVSRADRG